MAIPTFHAPHETPRPPRAVQVIVALNVTLLFLQWTVVRDADVVAALGFHEGSLSRSIWNAATYPFVHYGFWHLALNMSALLSFGPRLEAAMGTRAFTLYYLWCGLGGAVAHMLFLRTGVLVGASAAVLGVMLGFAHQGANEEVALFGGVRVRAWGMIVAFAATILALGMVDAEPAGGRWLYLAHLGGLAFGWLYFRTPPASLERLRRRVSPAPDYEDELPPRAIPRTQSRQRGGTTAGAGGAGPRDEVDEIVAQSNAALASTQRPAARALIAPTRPAAEAPAAELDRLLDKISSEGLESLTARERALLHDAARRLRGEGQ